MRPTVAGAYCTVAVLLLCFTTMFETAQTLTFFRGRLTEWALLMEYMFCSIKTTAMTIM